jgi:hypothetical protein
MRPRPGSPGPRTTRSSPGSCRRTGSTTYGVEADGRVFIYGHAWRYTLGCEGTHRREVGSEAEAQALAIGHSGRYFGEGSTGDELG